MLKPSLLPNFASNLEPKVVRLAAIWSMANNRPETCLSAFRRNATTGFAQHKVSLELDLIRADDRGPLFGAGRADQPVKQQLSRRMAEPINRLLHDADRRAQGIGELEVVIAQQGHRAGDRDVQFGKRLKRADRDAVLQGKKSLGWGSLGEQARNRFGCRAVAGTGALDHGLQPGVPHGLQIATLPFAHRIQLLFSGEANDAMVAMFNQVLYGKLRAGEVIRHDRRNSRSRDRAIKRHDRDVHATQKIAQRHIVRDCRSDHKAVDAVAKQRLHRIHFGCPIILRGEHDQQRIVGTGDGLSGFRAAREKRIGDAGDHKSDDPRAIPFESARSLVGHIAQCVDRTLDASQGIGVDPMPAIDGTRDSGRPHTGLPRYLDERGMLSLIQHRYVKQAVRRKEVLPMPHLTSVRQQAMGNQDKPHKFTTDAFVSHAAKRLGRHRTWTFAARISFLVRSVFLLCGPLLWAAGGYAAGQTPPVTPVAPAARVQTTADTLQAAYNPATGLFNGTGWWNSGNGITALANASRALRTHAYDATIANTFTVAQGKFPGFLNEFYDDEGWWALAWLDVYSLHRDPRYLHMAESIFADMTGGWSDTCGGGIWWKKNEHYKNAIANELFLSVAVGLAHQHRGKQKSNDLQWAEREAQWFRNSGMINEGGLVNDGLDASCHNNGRTTWSYNQGVILEGLAGLSELAHQPDALALANRIALAASTKLTDDQRVLHDPCEPRCGEDGVQFKGIFFRDLLALLKTSRSPQLSQLITTNADSAWNKARTAGNQFSTDWAGPPEDSGTGSLIAALDVLTAALGIDTTAQSAGVSSSQTGELSR